MWENFNLTFDWMDQVSHLSNSFIWELIFKACGRTYKTFLPILYYTLPENESCCWPSWSKAGSDVCTKKKEILKKDFPFFIYTLPPFLFLPFKTNSQALLTQTSFWNAFFHALPTLWPQRMYQEKKCGMRKTYFLINFWTEWHIWSYKSKKTKNKSVEPELRPLPFVQRLVF